MNKKLIALIFILVWMVAFAQSVFSPVTGKAIDIAVGANGAVWSVGTNFVVNQWTGSGWVQAPDQEGKWELHNGVYVWIERKDMLRIAVDPQGNPWAIDKKFILWRLVNKVWQQVATNTISVSIGVDGSVYRADLSNNMYKLSGSNWGASLGGNVAEIAVDPRGNVWTTSAKGKISKLSNGRQESIEGESYNLTTSSNGMVFHLGLDYNRIWLWTGTSWVNIGSVPNANRIAADPRGAVWVVNKEGAIFKSTPFTP
jgi:hypothetical protein